MLALVNRGHILSDLRRHEDAIASYRKALEIDPLEPQARSPMAWAAMAVCDWSFLEKIASELKRGCAGAQVGRATGYNSFDL